MITDQQYADWLADDLGNRVVLVEAEYYGGIELFASSPFISMPTDTPANSPYDDLLLSMGDIVSRVDRSVDVGDLVLVNDGSLDSWIGRAWLGQSLRVYLGDSSWSRDDFRLVVDGINGGIEAPQSSRIEFLMFDQAAKLDQPLQATRLADNTPVPLCYGRVFNCEPVLINAASLIYQVHESAVTSIVVRDNGIVVVPSATDLANGQFTLGAPPAGQVTADVVQADSTAAEIVSALVGRLTGISIDTDNFAAFPNTAVLGYYSKETRTANEALKALLQPLGAFHRFTPLGDLQLIRIGAPVAATVTLAGDDIASRGLRLLATEQPSSRIELGYQPNWRRQGIEGLAAGVADANKKLYSDSHSWVTADNSLSGYPMAVERKLETLLALVADAQAEADRRAAVRSVKRERWQVQAFLGGLGLQLGDSVTIEYPRHGFESGRVAVVLMISKNPLKRQTTLEVFL